MSLEEKNSNARIQVGQPPRPRMLRRLLELADLTGMATAFVVATLLVPLKNVPISIEQFLAMRLSVTNVALLAGLLLLWHVVLSLFRLYDTTRPMLAARMRDVLKAVSLNTAIVLAAGLSFAIEIVTPLFLLVFWATSNATLGLLRVALRFGFRLLFQYPSKVRYILIAGTTPGGLRFAQKLGDHPESGCQVVGFADEESPWLDAFIREDRHLACDLKNLGSFLRENVIDEVVIALPLGTWNARGAKILATCEEHGVTVRFLSSVFQAGEQGASSLPEDAIVMTFYHGAVDGLPSLAKRVVDLVLASALLCGAIPVFLITGLSIKLTSRGPVFFVQDRVGFGKRHFGMYKFRTMYPGAADQIESLAHLNEAGGPVFKLKDDPRVTPIGRILRATSIDELPQLMNVLKGEMSLVGPRPLPLRDVAGFDDDRHRRRFSVRPGLTGLWQVSGRSSVSFERWMELDLQYIDEWSLGNDLKILLKTVPAVLSRVGAE